MKICDLFIDVVGHSSSKAPIDGLTTVEHGRLCSFTIDYAQSQLTMLGLELGLGSGLGYRFRARVKNSLIKRSVMLDHS